MDGTSSAVCKACSLFTVLSDPRMSLWLLVEYGRGRMDPNNDSLCPSTYHPKDANPRTDGGHGGDDVKFASLVPGPKGEKGSWSEGTWSERPDLEAVKVWRKGASPPNIIS